MVNASYKSYESYEKFITEFIFSVIENGHSAIIVNYQDYQGLVASLNGKVLNGETITLDLESRELFDEDILVAQNGDGNIMVTVYESGVMTGEPVIHSENERAFADTIYFVESSAAESAMKYAITSRFVPFKIEKKIRL